MAAHITAKYSTKPPAGAQSGSGNDTGNGTKVFYRSPLDQALYDQQMIEVATGEKLLSLRGLKRVVKPKRLRKAFVSSSFECCMASYKYIQYGACFIIN